MHFWHFWQLADSSFPAGGFAHSGGLEAAVQQMEVRDEAEFENFLSEALWQTGYGALPLVTEAHRDPLSLRALDHTCDIFLSSHVANRASRNQGRTFFSTCLHVFENAEVQTLGAMHQLEPLKLHYAPIFGATLTLLHVEKENAQRLFLYLSLRGIVSSAIRLGIFGPYQAQKIQWRFAPLLDEILNKCGLLEVTDLAQIAPLPEILLTHHDRLYSKLFQS